MTVRGGEVEGLVIARDVVGALVAGELLRSRHHSARLSVMPEIRRREPGVRIRPALDPRNPEIRVYRPQGQMPATYSI